MCIPHLPGLTVDADTFCVCAIHCETDGNVGVVAACDVNLGVGGPDDNGDLIELVESGGGLEAGSFRKTRAGGN